MGLRRTLRESLARSRGYGEAGGHPLFKEARTQGTALGHPLLEARVSYRGRRPSGQFGGYSNPRGWKYL